MITTSNRVPKKKTKNKKQYKASSERRNLYHALPKGSNDSNLAPNQVSLTHTTHTHVSIYTHISATSLALLLRESESLILYSGQEVVAAPRGGGVKMRSMASSGSNRGIAAVVGVGPKLGRSIARKFAHEGYTVAILARDLGTNTTTTTPYTNLYNVVNSI